VIENTSILPGDPHLLGATVMTEGVNFAVHSRQAAAVDLCLYDPAEASREIARVRMRRSERDVWHVFVKGLKPGALYGYRAHGPWLPLNGLRFNPHKLLLDPYAKAVVGTPQARADMLAPEGPHSLLGATDNGSTALKSVVVDESYDWQGDKLPRTPWSDTILYELHVKGFTQKHPKVPAEFRGSYAGLAQPAVIQYLKQLGITAVQLLPVHQHLDDGFLVDRGLTNYWGYNTIGFFAPHNEYAATRDPLEQVREFKDMVRALHAAGIEVILDVVYNHTAEGDERGPYVMFRGLDNTGYYRHGSDSSGLYYQNLTGCGNSVASQTAPALRLILDSLRYWVTEMHVDGFRFDLAVTVARDREAYDHLSPFLSAVAQDPVLSQVKLIAEPWDVSAEDSYQVGNFPEPWRELNGKYRDAVRRYWRGDENSTAEFAKRFCGSEDVYGWANRPPLASVNLITSHDGFTLRDLVSHSQKHNHANGEDNRDGDNDNHSTNCGHEGETKDPQIKTRRVRMRRSLLASMLCSQGVPFITAGDERGRTQRGNNNAYCQDNDLSWVDWKETASITSFVSFVRQMIAFRKARPALRRSRFFDGKPNPETGRRDVTWLSGAGGLLSREEWHRPLCEVFGALLDAPDRKTSAVIEGEDHRPLLLLFNHGEGASPFMLPGDAETGWALVFDTGSDPTFVDEALLCHGSDAYELQPRSMACLVLRNESRAV
jgi:isoamylase